MQDFDIFSSNLTFLFVNLGNTATLTEVLLALHALKVHSINNEAKVRAHFAPLDPSNPEPVTPIANNAKLANSQAPTVQRLVKNVLLELLTVGFW